MSISSRISNQSKRSKANSCTCKFHTASNDDSDSEENALNMVVIAAPEGDLDQTPNEFVAAQLLWRDLQPPTEKNLCEIKDPISAEQVEIIRASLNRAQTECKRNPKGGK